MPATLQINGLEVIGPAGALAQILGGQIFPETARAVENSLKRVRNHAVQLAAQRMKRPSGEFIRGIRIVPESDLAGKVVSQSPHHSIVENGHASIHMKKILQTSPKVRVSKHRVVRGHIIGGHRYLYVPFRHHHDTVPEPVRMLLEDEGRSYVTEIYQERSKQVGQKGRMVTRFKYHWGGRYQGGDNPRQEGLVKMGRAGHGTYMTFRTMTENPSARARWTIPAREGYHIFRDTKQFVESERMEEQIAAALQRDVRASGAIG